MTQRGFVARADSVSPFLKWAGGKRWLVKRHRHLFPDKIPRLVEPFVGSAAVFFELVPEKALLADSNEWLIETYEALRQDWRRVARHLETHARRHCLKYYYSVRHENPQSAYARAANLIYLNRTCWNGLFRVNFDGKFNVPRGTKEKVILDTDNFELVSKRLRSATLMCADFADTIAKARVGDVIYADPPYLVRHGNNGFVKYNERLFTWGDQVRLCDCLRRAYQRGCIIMASNAQHKSIRELYAPWAKLITLRRPSVIAGANHARGQCHEYLIIAS
jgi:DNA adenine methylase